MSSRTIVITRGDAGERIDLVLRRHLADVRDATRTRVQAWIRNGAVSINGRPAIRPAMRAACGDIVHLEQPAAPPPRARAVMIADADSMRDVRVLYEDDHLLAVSKPPGMVVHPTYRHPTGTLMNGLLWHARGWPSPQRPSLVGRLDRLTSGIVLVARTRAVHASLQRALASAASQKDYLALVYGRVTRSRGTIDLTLRRDERDRRRVVASPAGGRPSLTAFERLARVSAARAGLALLRCRLLTGRMHQIRVHLAACGWPIVGDPVYGEARWTRVVDERLATALAGFPRQALHAWRLSFPHPVTGRPVRVEAALPADMRELMKMAALSARDVEPGGEVVQG